MARSGQNVSAAEPAEQRRQGAYILVTGGNRPHCRWSATEDMVLAGRTERFCTGALVEDGRSLQRAGRGGAVKVVSRTGGAADGRSAGGAGAGKQGTAGADAPVRCLLAGSGTVETAGIR